MARRFEDFGMQRRSWMTGCAGVGAIVLATCASAQTAPQTNVAASKKGAITGVVRARDAAPAAGVLVAAAPTGAEVELFPVAAAARTDASGRFRLELDSGLYCVA